MTLGRNFFEQSTLRVARELLGARIVFHHGGVWRRARILETEAYIGERDKACHAHRGRTARTEVMYGPAAHCYVYLIYGMHYCLNIVTEAVNKPCAVLIRGVAIQDRKIFGPGRVTAALGVTTLQNNKRLSRANGLFIEPGSILLSEKINRGRRIGVDYADEYRHKPWRFLISNSQFGNSQ